jgi:hypothetical protein
MYEYTIVHRNTNATEIIFGYNYADACRRCKVDPTLYDVIDYEYVD